LFVFPDSHISLGMIS